MSNAEHEDPNDPETAAHFVASTFGPDEFMKLEALLIRLPVTQRTAEADDPFCSDDSAIFGTLHKILEHVSEMVERPPQVIMDNPGTFRIVRHIVGPDSPSKDRVELTTLLQASEKRIRMLVCSIITRASEQEWVIFDNHSTEKRR